MAGWQLRVSTASVRAWSPVYWLESMVQGSSGSLHHEACHSAGGRDYSETNSNDMACVEFRAFLIFTSAVHVTQRAAATA